MLFCSLVFVSPTAFLHLYSLYFFLLFSTDDFDGLSLSLLALSPIDPTAKFFSSVAFFMFRVSHVLM